MQKIIFFLSCSLLMSCNFNRETRNDVKVENQGVAVVNFQEFERYMEQHPSDVLVVNFWATWCKPCIQELPAFESLRKNYKDNDVAVILVSLDFPDQLEKLKAFVAKKELKSEILFLTDGNANEWIPKVDKQWTGAIPATLITTQESQQFYERSFTYQELEEELQKQLN